MKKLINYLLNKLGLWKYKFLSNYKIIRGEPLIIQPCLFLGNGEIIIEGTVSFGYYPSPSFYNGYIHIEARNKDSIVQFGNKTHINNNCVFISEGDCVFISEGEGIFIGDDVLIGHNVLIVDSDFHPVAIDKTYDPLNIKTARVIIHNNVFIGSEVKILKGVKIGENTVIGCGSVVTKSFPPNVIIAGNPAKIVKELN
jgi:galactoside O-acetyltransferase